MVIERERRKKATKKKIAIVALIVLALSMLSIHRRGIVAQELTSSTKALRLTTDDARYDPGVTVNITLDNICSETVEFLNIQKVRILGPLPSTTEVWPGIYLPALSYLDPDERVIYQWGQTDWITGALVPEGIYRVEAISELVSEPFMYFRIGPASTTFNALRLTTDHARYSPGQEVIITVENIGDDSVDLTVKPGVTVYNEDDYEVWPGIYLMQIDSLSPGEIRTFTWDQEDWETGMQVPRGYYKVETISELVQQSFTHFEATGMIKEDLNGDDTVGMNDMGIVAAAYGSRPGDSRWNPVCDLMKDNVIDDFDANMVGRMLGWSAGDPITPAPTEWKLNITIDHMVRGIESHTVTVYSDYVVYSNYTFDHLNAELIFDVTSSIDAFCNITIPRGLLNGAFRVELDDAAVPSILTWNGTHTWIYFNSTQLSHRVKIVGLTPGDVTAVPGETQPIVDIYDVVFVSLHLEDPLRYIEVYLGPHFY